MKILFLGASLLSGIFVGTSYIPYSPWALFFCYVPLWGAILISESRSDSQLSLRFLFLGSWITQFVLTLIGFNWIYFVATEFGHLPSFIAGAALLLFASLMHIYIPLAFTIAVYCKRKWTLSTTQLVFLFALFLVLAERLWPSIFPWHLGYATLWMKWPFPQLFQWADAIGFAGLSAVILILQALLTLALVQIKNDTLFSTIKIIFIFLFLFGLNIAGKYKQKAWSNFDDELRLSLIQGNIGNDEKLMAEKGGGFQSYVYQVHADLVQKELTHSPDVILWPETAMPFALDQHWSNRANQQRLFSTIKSWNTPLITGGYSQDQFERDHTGELKIRNSVFFIGPQGQLDQPYFKSQLLVFGEYMPFGKEFPFLYKLLPFVGVYEKGPGPVLKTIQTSNRKTFNLGPQICYESLDPDFSRGLSKAGADILFNVTNDSWFGDWAEPYQHMIMTLARAVEVRRPLLRSTNTGISTVILANGKILEQSPIGQPWSHTYTIPFKRNNESSFFTEIGHFDWVIWTLTIIGIFVLRRKKHYAGT